MRGLELRNTVDNLLKRSSSVDETTPINLGKNKSTDHGTIPMDRTLSADNIYQSSCAKKHLSDSEESKTGETPQRMSLLRKLCFVLSFNGGILYVVAFAWLIPCRFSPCLLSEDKWTLNLTNLRLSTNLMTNTHSNPTLVIFGHNDTSGGILNSLMIANGTESWNKTLPFEPLQVFCNLKDNCEFCYVTGKNSLAAVHADNGTIIWNKNLTSDESFSKLFLTQEQRNETYLVGITDSNLHLFEPEDGKEVATAYLPCSWSVDVKVVGPWLSKEGFIWALICQYDDGIEAFTFNESELFHISRNESAPQTLNVNFTSIFKKQSDSGSIDLACDVTTTPYSLVLSWADMVTMVTAQAPFHHFKKTWERRFSSPLGYAVDVTSITTGFFSGSESIQIAVAVQEGSNSTVHILEVRNGSSIVESEFHQKKIVSIKRLSGGERDALLIESIEIDSSSNDTSSRSFHMLEYEESQSALRFIATSKYHITSSLSQISKGSSNLILASSDTNGNTILDRFIVENKDPEKSWCRDVPNDNTSVMLLLE